jgi:hypothetical protein
MKLCSGLRSRGAFEESVATFSKMRGNLAFIKRKHDATRNPFSDSDINAKGGVRF